MRRKLKTLGLALVAAFAISAVVASAASANFTTATDNTTMTLLGGNQVFKTEGGAKAECTSALGYVTKVATVQTELTAVPEYSGCTFTEGSITRLAKIDPMGCTYVFTATEQVHIECSGTNVITVKLFIIGAYQQCLDIQPQTPTSPKYHLANGSFSGQMDFALGSTVSGITYERTWFCKMKEVQLNETNNAYYEGSVTVVCETEAGVAVDCTSS
jgi:hypothetical protein